MLIYVKLLMTAFFWGGTFIAGRSVAQHVGPFSAAFIRFVIASIVLLTVVRRSEGRFPRVPRQQIVPLILLGMSGIFAYNVFFFLGLKHIDAGRAALIIANNPVFTALFAAWLFKDRLGAVRSFGILVSVFGAMIVITDGRLMNIAAGGIGSGELYIFGCVASWVVFSLIGKTVMAHVTPLVAVAYASFIGTLALFLPACFEGLFHQLSSYIWADWFGLFYLGLFGTAIGFVWYYEGIKQMGPAAASQFINFVPVSAVLLAYLILQEPLTVSLLVGMVCVSTGVYIVNTAGVRKGGFRRLMRKS